MDDQKQDNTFMPEQDEASSPQPIRFHRPHISQELINIVYAPIVSQPSSFDGIAYII